MKKLFFKTFLIISPVILTGVLFVQQVKAEPYGWSPNVDNSWQGPPKCGDSSPGVPVLYQPNHPILPQPKEKGQVRLQWTKVNEASGYNIYYGLSPKNYIYSVPNLPAEATNYTISFLVNKNYYFAVQANRGCAGSPLSNSWMARPAKGGYYVASVATAYKPVKRVASTTVLGKSTGNVVNQTPVVPTTSPVSPEVKGASTGQAPTVRYEAPPVRTYQPTVPKALPTPSPKPKGLIDSIISFFLGK